MQVRVEPAPSPINAALPGALHAVASAAIRQEKHTEGSLGKHAKRSLCVFSRKNWFRKRVGKLVDWVWFDRFILAVIVVNSVILALPDFSTITPDGNLSNDSWRNLLLDKSEIYFTTIFTAEAVLKIIAYGFLFEKGTYLHDGWNVLDFAVVLSALISLIPNVPNVSAFRTVRVLRPLRSLTILPEMHKLISSLLGSIPNLVSVVVILTFSLSMFDILGVQTWGGMLHARCRTTPTPVKLATGGIGPCYDLFSPTCGALLAQNGSVVPCLPDTPNDAQEWDQHTSPWSTPQDCFWPVDVDDTFVCSLVGTGEHLCGAGKFCGSDYDAFGNPRFLNAALMSRTTFSVDYGFGFVGFDNFGTGLLTVFQVITMEGWTDIMYMFQDAHSSVYAAFFFIMLVLFGSYFLVNLTLAVIWDSFESYSKAAALRAAETASEYDDEDSSSDGEFDDEHGTEDYPVDGTVPEPAELQLGIATPLGQIPENTTCIEPQIDTAGTLQELIPTNHMFTPTTPATPTSYATSAKPTPGGRRPSQSSAAGESPRSLWRSNTGATGVFARNRRHRRALTCAEAWRCGSKHAIPHRVVTHTAFSIFILLCILFNTAVLASDHYPIDSEMNQDLEIANFALTVLFGLEMLLKLWGLGPKAYAKDTFNLFDAAIVVLSLVEVAIIPPGFTTPEAGDGGNTGAFSSLRIIRLFRVFKLARNWKSLQVLLQTIIRTVADVANFAVLLLLFMYIFALVGMQLFANAFCFDVDTGLNVQGLAGVQCDPAAGFERSRSNFDSIFWAFITVFQVLTQENWNNVLYDAHRASGWAASLYFVALVVIGNFIVLNLFLAILLGNFDGVQLMDTGNDAASEPDQPAQPRKWTWAWLMWKVRGPPRRRRGSKRRPSGSMLSDQELQQLQQQHGFSSNQSAASLNAVRSTQSLRNVAEDVGQLRRSGQISPQHSFSTPVRESSHVPGAVNSISNRVLVPEARPLIDEDHDPESVPVTPVHGSHLEVHVSHTSLVSAPSGSSLLAGALESKRHERVLPPLLQSPSASSLPAISASGGVEVEQVLSPSIQPPRLGAFTTDALESDFGHYHSDLVRDSTTPEPLNDRRGSRAPPEHIIEEPSESPRVSMSMIQVPNHSSGKVPHSARHEPSPRPQIEAPRRYPMRQFTTMESMGSRVIPPPVVGKSLFLFGPHNALRLKLAEILQHKWFDNCILVIICLSSITLAMDNPLQDPASTIVKVIQAADTVFSVIFVLEMVMKCVAYGFLFQTKAYLRSGWNQLDFAIVVISILSLTPASSGSLRSLRTIRTLRAFRPLRLVARRPELRLVVAALLSSIKPVINVLFVCLLFYLIFGIVGVNYFKGTFYGCQGPAYDTMTIAQQALVVHPQPWTALSAAQQQWIPAAARAAYQAAYNTTMPTSRIVCGFLGADWDYTNDQTFDNIAAAMGTLFQISTTEGWVNVMQAAVDGTSIDMQPIRDNGWAWALYFVAFIVVGTFFTTNLFVGVVIDNFNTMKERLGDGWLLTDSQKDWLKAQKRLMNNMPPARSPPASSNHIPYLCYKIVHHRWFDTTIMCCIVLNGIVMAATYFGESAIYTKACEILNVCFSAVFTLEAVLKILAIQKAYFADPWNRFDLVVVIGSNVGIGLKYGANMDVGTVATIARLFRVGRVFRLIRQFESLHKLFRTLVLTLPSLANITGLMLLLLFVYAVIGIQLFATVQWHGSINHHANFTDLWKALLLLMRCTTGEAWDELMYRFSEKLADCDSDVSYNPRMCGFSSAPDCIPLNGCGTQLAFPFFMSFTVIMTFVFLNLFIAVILEGFADTADGLISESDVRNFYGMWQMYDPFMTRVITANDMESLIQSLPEPLGFGKSTGRESVEVRLARLRLPLYEGNKVHLRDVSHALMGRHFGHAEIPDSHFMAKEWRRKFPDPPLRVTSFTLGTLYSARRVEAQWQAFRFRKSIGQRITDKQDRLPTPAAIASDDDAV